MRKTIYTFCICLNIAFGILAQQRVEEVTQQSGFVRLGYAQDAVFPVSEIGYVLKLPSSQTRGVIISLDDEKGDENDTTYHTMYRLCESRGLAILHVFTGIPVDLFMDTTSLLATDSLLTHAFQKNKLTSMPVFFLGVMPSGHRALRFVEFMRSGKTRFKKNPQAMILCESALDWVRQWYEGQKQIRDSLSEASFFEGNMVYYLFAEKLKATPLTRMQDVVNFSSYSYFDAEQKKPSLYSDIPVRAYTYADLAYWFTAPGKGMLDSNYPDMSGFINEQKLAGNTRAELIVYHSSEKGPPPVKHRPQSKTWSLIDKNDLVSWMMKHLED